ncbi:Zinc finger, C2H2 domain containing protein [Trema orientale]|uniref:Zinc finger, C2H2 domain containing protein n=1 Tax=Trema orientale TaxID=63057 RepID=A0A2P5F553_TREOI|nr:Zinc finger, C2H2 domain containing protein [Trema orientale]
MVLFSKLGTVLRTVQLKRLETLRNPFAPTIRYFHPESNLGFGSTVPSSSPEPRIHQKNVAIFWDLDNKPPNPFPPYQAALKLKKTASSFGFVRHMVAYANRHAFSYVPAAIREQRRERNKLTQVENEGLVKPPEPYLCRVCGRNFYYHEKLLNHFKQIHEREHTKRLNQIESARGSQRVKLVAKYSMKMEKYKNAAREILTPKAGYGLADELKRAGFLVRRVSDKPQAADIEMKNHIVEMMDRRRAECLVLVSDDSDFASVVQEAKMRCLKTVVVGNVNDGVLKRIADSGFSWKEIMMGKAQKEAVSVLGKWKDRDVLRRLEWTYKPEEEEKSEYGLGDESEDEDVESNFEGEDDGSMQKDKRRSWWEMESDADSMASRSCK